MKHKSFLLLFFVAIYFHGRANNSGIDTKAADTIFKIASVLQSNMVIQQNKPFKVWGSATAGDTVLIYADWMNNPITTIADDSNKFMGIVAAPQIKKGDYTKHTLSINTHNHAIILNNILIGEVWICSGQSNMQFAMKGTIDSTQEINAANYPNIRLFNSELNFSNEPIDSIKGKWLECTPQTVKNFSAVAYHFGHELYKFLQVPVGIIFTGIGASSAQAYVPRDVLAFDSLLDSIYLQPYLRSEKSKETMNGGFSFEKVTRPFLLYNAMIHPFTNFSIQGFCWYQGESNRSERESYTHLTETLIKSWRKNFGQGNLPFYYVEVAPFFYDIEDSTLADYAFFREAQENISKLNNTEMVVTMDVGEAKNLHPKNKKPIGIRLAKTALNRTYGKLDVAYKGPQFEYAEFNANRVIIHFEDETVISGLETNDAKEPRYFFVAAADRVFYPARATINGKNILLASVKVKKPVAVRYAFTNYPVTNLQNKDGFPAIPFRTDSWTE